MEPIPNEVDEPKQRNSDQDARHEEGPIVFWFSVHPKLGSVGLCRCGLQIRSLRTSRKVVRKQKFFEVFDGQQISQTTFVLDFGSKGANNSRSKKFALCRCQRTAEGKMEGEKRERWMRLCVEAADGQDSNRLLELISEIDRLLREKEMRLRNVRREASRYVIEAAEKKAS